MKSSKSNKNDIDDISRETQRIISDSHVRLPYHKSKQKSLKDFLNRHKMLTECQASITGSKKLLQKAWDFIEIKEQNVEQFYNEEGCQSENFEKTSSVNDNIGSEKTFSLTDNYNKELITKDKADDVPSESSDNDDEEENIKYKNIISENSDEEENYPDVLSKISDNEEDDCSQASSLCSEKCLTQEVLTSDNNEDSENDSNSSNFELHADHHNIKKNIAKDYIDDEAESSELEYSSDDDNDEDNLPTFIDESDDDIKEFSKKKRCQKILLSESSDDESISNTEIKLTSDDLIPLFNEPDTNISTQQLMGLCSGEFLTQHSEPEENDQDSEDDFDSSVPQKDSPHKHAQSIDNEDFEGIPKLTSAKDFFDEEAELSESDWSSDDEDHLVDNIDTLEEEIGDRDALDEDIVKDGLDKIYMRQLLDDDKQQVSALKEMLLEDGNLHSDSGRKRKFQWETDENDIALKKPLFSDEDNDEEENDDDTTEQWRTERFKREAYLIQKNKIEEEKSNDILQTSISVVKKSTDILQSNKVIKGSFLKHTNTNKMATTLLYINKKTIVTNNDETHTGKLEEKSQIKSNTSSNPFAYLLRNDNKPEIKDDTLMSEKKENICLRNSHTSIESTHETKSKKSVNSILKQLLE